MAEKISLTSLMVFLIGIFAVRINPKNPSVSYMFTAIVFLYGGFGAWLISTLVVIWS